MCNWSIETMQRKNGSWVGIVKKLDESAEVHFISSWHPTAMFAFLECLHWLQRNAPSTELENKEQKNLTPKLSQESIPASNDWSGRTAEIQEAASAFAGC